MTQEALKLAEIIEHFDSNDESLPLELLKEISATLRALAQTQEPWCMKMNDCKTKCEDCPDEPPKRTWVRLTDEDRLRLWLKTEAEDVDRYAFAKAIEAKIKELNT